MVRKKGFTIGRFLKGIIFLINLLAVVALLASYSSTFISPAKIWHLAFLGLAYPYVLIVNIFFCVFWLLFKPKLVLFSLIAILIGFGHLGNYYQIKPQKTSASGLTICSYNIKNFQQTQGERRETAVKIQNYLRDKNADIICIQEMTTPPLNPFNPFPPDASGKLPDFYTTYKGEITEPAVYSRYPIINTGKIRFDNSNNKIVFADLKLDGDTIRIYSCHMQSYLISEDEINYLDTVSIGSDRDQNIRQFRQIASKIKQAFIKRASHSEQLRDSIKQSPYPAIVCGDFNDTPVSYTYHTITSVLNDAFTESGRGAGSTYEGKLPPFRIDYIFYSKAFDAYNFQVDKVNYSDHYPVSCLLIRR